MRNRDWRIGGLGICKEVEMVGEAKGEWGEGDKEGERREMGDSVSRNGWGGEGGVRRGS